MSNSINRRQFMTWALQAAAVGAMAPLVHLGEAPKKAVEADGVVRLHWDRFRRNWPVRPIGASGRVLFISTDDAHAPEPSDFELELGDVWWRHPSCARTAGGTTHA